MEGRKGREEIEERERDDDEMIDTTPLLRATDAPWVHPRNEGHGIERAVFRLVPAITFALPSFGPVGKSAELAGGRLSPCPLPLALLSISVSPPHVFSFEKKARNVRPIERTSRRLSSPPFGAFCSVITHHLIAPCVGHVALVIRYDRSIVQERGAAVLPSLDFIHFTRCQCV